MNTKNCILNIFIMSKLDNTCPIINIKSTTNEIAVNAKTAFINDTLHNLLITTTKVVKTDNNVFNIIFLPKSGILHTDIIDNTLE